MKQSPEYNFIKSLKGKKVENWNWQAKERVIGKRMAERQEMGSPAVQGRKTRGKNNLNRSVILSSNEEIYQPKKLAKDKFDFDPSTMEQELLEMDRQIKLEGGFLLKQ